MTVLPNPFYFRLKNESFGLVYSALQEKTRFIVTCNINDSTWIYSKNEFQKMIASREYIACDRTGKTLTVN